MKLGIKTNDRYIIYGRVISDKHVSIMYSDTKHIQKTLIVDLKEEKILNALFKAGYMTGYRKGRSDVRDPIRNALGLH